MSTTDNVDLGNIKNTEKPTSSGGWFCCANERNDKGGVGTETKALVKDIAVVKMEMEMEKEKGSASATAATAVSSGDDQATINAKAIFAILDEDGSGEIEKVEFKDRLRDHEALAKVFFANSGFKKPIGGEWADLAVGKNSKKVFASIDTTGSESRSKRILTINEITTWCRKTGAFL